MGKKHRTRRKVSRRKREVTPIRTRKKRKTGRTRRRRKRRKTRQRGGAEEGPDFTPMKVSSVNLKVNSDEGLVDRDFDVYEVTPNRIVDYTVPEKSPDEDFDEYNSRLKTDTQGWREQFTKAMESWLISQNLSNGIFDIYSELCHSKVGSNPLYMSDLFGRPTDTLENKTVLTHTYRFYFTDSTLAGILIYYIKNNERDKKVCLIHVELLCVRPEYRGLGTSIVGRKGEGGDIYTSISNSRSAIVIIKQATQSAEGFYGRNGFINGGGSMWKKTKKSIWDTVIDYMHDNPEIFEDDDDMAQKVEDAEADGTYFTPWEQALFTEE